VKHPSDEQLLKRLMDGEAAVDAMTAKHLAEACSRCDQRMRQFGSVLESLRAGTLADVPEAWTTRALAWLREQGESAGAKGSRRGRGVASAVGALRRAIEEVRAALALDTAAGAVLSGVRGVAAASERQILLESPAGQVILRVTPTATGRFEVQGQFLCERADFDAGKARVVLSGSGKETVRRMSANGEFRFTAVPPGTVQVRVEGETLRVTTDPVGLTARGDG
jgi:hypothetical protein